MEARKRSIEETESIIRTDLRGPWRGTELDGAELPVTCSLPARSLTGLSHLLAIARLHRDRLSAMSHHVSLSFHLPLNGESN